MDSFQFPTVRPVNGYKGTIFSPSCGTHRSSMTNRYFDLRTGKFEDEGLEPTYANTVVNDAIGIVFGDLQNSFSAYDCTGKSCSNGIIRVEDVCEGFQCSPYCNPAYSETAVVLESEEQVLYVEEEIAMPQSLKSRKD